MNIRFTEEALGDLETILRFISEEYPFVYESFEMRLDAVLKLISSYSASAPEAANRPGVRMVHMHRYPYRIFYRVEKSTIEILYIHHTTRRPK